MEGSEHQDVPEMVPEGEKHGNGQPGGETTDGAGELEEECDGAIEELLSRIEYLERRCAALEKSAGDHHAQYEHTLRRVEQQPPRERHWYLRTIGK